MCIVLSLLLVSFWLSIDMLLNKSNEYLLKMWKKFPWVTYLFEKYTSVAEKIFNSKYSKHNINTYVQVRVMYYLSDAFGARIGFVAKLKEARGT